MNPPYAVGFVSGELWIFNQRAGAGFLVGVALSRTRLMICKVRENSSMRSCAYGLPESFVKFHPAACKAACHEKAPSNCVT
jgi:hypothetical protein